MNNLRQKTRNSICSNTLNDINLNEQSNEKFWLPSNYTPYNNNNLEKLESLNNNNNNIYLNYNNISTVDSDNDKPFNFPPPPPLLPIDLQINRSLSTPPIIKTKNQNELLSNENLNQNLLSNTKSMTKISKSSSQLFNELDERVSRSRKTLKKFYTTDKLDDNLFSYTLPNNNNKTDSKYYFDSNNKFLQYKNNQNLSDNLEINQLKNNSSNIWAKQCETLPNNYYDTKYNLLNNYNENFKSENNNIYIINNNKQNNLFSTIPKQKNSYGRPSESEDSALPGLFY